MATYYHGTVNNQLSSLQQEIQIFRDLAKQQFHLHVKYSKQADENEMFSALANQHKKNCDKFNSNAVTCILQMHALRHNNNPDLLDLHGLQVNEADECLNQFIDARIEQLREEKSVYKKLIIITGQGNHSVYGYSQIKVNTKNRLLERYLMSSEINHGCLQVAILQNSLLSTEINGR